MKEQDIITIIQTMNRIVQSEILDNKKLSQYEREVAELVNNGWTDELLKLLERNNKKFDRYDDCMKHVLSMPEGDLQ